MSGSQQQPATAVYPPGMPSTDLDVRFARLPVRGIGV